MSNIAELTMAVRDFLQYSLNTTDAFPGEADAGDVDCVIDRRILRAANNARLWAERQHDFAENDVSVRLDHQTGIQSYLYGVPYEDPAEQVVYYGKLVVVSGAGTLTYVGSELTAAGSVTLFVESGNDPHSTTTVTSDEATVDSIASSAATLSGVAFDDGTYQVVYAPGTVLTSITYYKMKTIANAFIKETEGLRPLWIKSRRSAALQARRSLDLLEAEPYIRYPDDDVDNDSTRPFLFWHGDRIEVAPQQSVTLRIEGQRWMDSYTLQSDTDFLLQKGFDFMMWAAIVEVNHITQTFLPRQEGSLTPPVKMRDEAWMTLIANDEYRFDGNVAHDM